MHYQKRILKNKKLHELYKEALSLFIENPKAPKLHTHTLKGKMSSKKAFSVDDECRVIYLEDEDKFLFLDIGSHDEGYS